MNRAYYSDSIINFQNASTDEIIGKLTRTNDFALEQTQREAWVEEINILHKALTSYKGYIYFEYSIPRMGQRIDVVILIGAVIFVLEFKIGEKEFTSHAIDLPPLLYHYELEYPALIDSASTGMPVENFSVLSAVADSCRINSSGVRYPSELCGLAVL